MIERGRGILTLKGMGNECYQLFCTSIQNISCTCTPYDLKRAWGPYEQKGELKCKIQRAKLVDRNL